MVEGEGRSSAMVAIDKIIESEDWFTTLAMEFPSTDALGRPQWPFDEEDVSRAHRKLARYCHPDKIQQMGEEDAALAERAYEKLRLAKEGLSREDSRGPCVRAWVKDNLKAVRNFAEGGASGGCAVQATEQVREKEEKERREKRDLRGEESRAMGDGIAQQMERKRKMAEERRLAKEARMRAGGDDSSEDSDEVERLKAKGPMVKKKEESDSDEDERGKSKRKRNAGRGGRRGGRAG